MQTVEKTAGGRPGVAVFQHHAARYEAWFDTPRGWALFESEAQCLRRVSRGLPRPWLEVGVGTGRFARALGIDVGVDPAGRMLPYALARGVPVAEALGEALPFADGSFGAVFVVVTICFAQDPAALFREARRVLKEGGGLVLGIVSAGSPWGRFYRVKAEAGHPFYSAARFFSPEELDRFARDAGLTHWAAASTLFRSPQDEPVQVEQPHDGIARTAGFVSLRYERGSGGPVGEVGAGAP
ncbi:MAG: methyltransferase domain-containing protein [Phycisphaerae bacterium]